VRSEDERTCELVVLRYDLECTIEVAHVEHMCKQPNGTEHAERTCDLRDGKPKS
jgi:hypothetical protein